MGLSRVGLGVTEMACPCRQLYRVDVDSRRRTVRFRNENDIQSIFCFPVIKIDRGKFLFLLDILLAIDFGVPWKGRRPDRELDGTIRRRVIDCFLPAWRIHVKTHGVLVMTPRRS